MEGVGMVYASKVAQRIRVAATTANRIASPHSRATLLGFLWVVSVAGFFSQNFTAMSQVSRKQLEEESLAMGEEFLINGGISD
jgi:hypothetical protein